eukprot:Gb_30226 [translate_table: standard]
MAEIQRQPPHAVVVPLPAQGSFADRNFCPSKGYVEVLTAMQHPQPGLSGFRYLCMPNGLPSDHVSATNALKFMQAVHKLGPAIIRFLRSVADEAPPNNMYCVGLLLCSHPRSGQNSWCPQGCVLDFLCNCCNRHSQLSAPPVNGISRLMELTLIQPMRLFRLPSMKQSRLCAGKLLRGVRRPGDNFRTYPRLPSSGCRPYISSRVFDGQPCTDCCKGLEGGFGVPEMVGYATTWICFVCLVWQHRRGVESAAARIGFRVEGKSTTLLVGTERKVVSHPSVGGFMTHCGWTSKLETISLGIPIIGWPLRADQFPNCRFSKKIWKIGMDFDSRSEDENVLVTRDEEEKVVRAVMQGQEGKSLRNNALKLKEPVMPTVQRVLVSFLEALLELVKNLRFHQVANLPIPIGGDMRLRHPLPLVFSHAADNAIYRRLESTSIDDSKKERFGFNASPINKFFTEDPRVGNFHGVLGCGAAPHAMPCPWPRPAMAHLIPIAEPGFVTSTKPSPFSNAISPSRGRPPNLAHTADEFEFTCQRWWQHFLFRPTPGGIYYVEEAPPSMLAAAAVYTGQCILKKVILACPLILSFYVLGMWRMCQANGVLPSESKERRPYSCSQEILELQIRICSKVGASTS